MEWEDSVRTVSSSSSDTYSTLGLVDTLSSTSASSVSNSATETDDDDDPDLKRCLGQYVSIDLISALLVSCRMNQRERLTDSPMHRR